MSSMSTDISPTASAIIASCVDNSQQVDCPNQNQRGFCNTPPLRFNSPASKVSRDPCSEKATWCVLLDDGAKEQHAYLGSTALAVLDYGENT